jgi:hypothetical protein
MENLHWNRDVWSTKIFIRNFPKYKYTSYIFGGSRSQAYTTGDWSHYTGDTNAFHFDASNESIYGIYTKLKYIDKIGGEIKNVLIISDSLIYAETSEDADMIYCKDYRISGKSFLGFQMTFFKSYCYDFFFIKYIDFMFFKTYKPYMKGVIPELHQTSYIDNVHNNADGAIYHSIKAIAQDSVGYYNDKKKFRDRPDNPGMERPCIDSTCLRMLHEIKGIFDKHNTRYRIVISPIYWSKKFNNESLLTLKQIFGDTNVYDFSGKNSITSFIGNYYEYSHYKISVGRKIMQDIYANKNP